MNRAIEIYQSDDLGFSVRTVLRDGEAWFIVADVSVALDLGNPRSSVALLDDDEKAVHSVDTNAGPREVSIVSEAGLYSLILRSRKPEAKSFKRWITHEVLPALRRTGTYSVAPAAPVAMPTYAESLRQLATALEEGERKDRIIEQLEPAAKFAVAVAGANGDLTVKDAAQILARDRAIKTGEGRLFKTLKAIQWIDKTARPYQRHIEVGRVAMKLSTYTEPSTGEVHVKPQALITPKGLRELHVLLGGQDSLSTLLHPELPGLRVVS